MLPISAGSAIIDDEGGGDERIRELHELIGRLNPMEKAIVMMWLDEQPYEEIAAITGLTRNNVASKLRRAKEKMRLLAGNGKVAHQRR